MIRSAFVETRAKFITKITAIVVLPFLAEMAATGLTAAAKFAAEYSMFLECLLSGVVSNVILLEKLLEVVCVSVKL